MAEGSRLHVAVVAPPYYSLPPRDYGGVELVCHTLADELVDRGLDVTLIGAGVADTRATFVATFDEPQPEGGPQSVQIDLLHAARVASVVADLDVDVVHDHTRVRPEAATRSAPTVLTVHAPLAGLDTCRDELTALTPAVDLVAISASQRADAPDLNWVATVPNGIPVTRYPVRASKEGFSLYLGRISPQKGVEAAVAAARATGRRLVIAGSWTVPEERQFFDARVRPLLGDDVEWVGPVGFRDKVDLLGRAGCLLFPAQWREPFGLVVIEAFACGTPVVALRAGAVSELVVDGVTGLICDSPNELPAAIMAADLLSPAECRAHAETHFSAAVMAAGYDRVYRESIATP